VTLADLAALVPCDAATVSRVESGLLSPTERFAAACAEAFPRSARVCDASAYPIRRSNSSLSSRPCTNAALSTSMICSR
jgi:hypothetical protein